jgi:prepilin-type N-terminal cleavage/methylation domain-containing protein
MSKHVSQTRLTAPSGFTLIELSVVMVIIGLIMGGVMVGVAQIEQFKIRAQMSQFKQYETAYYQFKDVYGGIPGDLVSPTQFWPGIASPSSTSQRGNGTIDNQTAGNNGFSNTGKEGLHFYLQLGKSGLVGREFTGTFVKNDGVLMAKINESIGVGIGQTSEGASGTQLSAAERAITYAAAMYLNNIDFSGAGQLINTGVNAGVTPEQVKNMDVKMDDGIARKGKLKAYTLRGNTTNMCLTGTDGDYNLSSPDRVCVIEYILEFMQ